MTTPVHTGGGIESIAPDTSTLTAAAGAIDRRSQLIAAARRLLETEGIEALTIRRLGAAIGMRGPSVYKHVPDKATIEVALMIQALTEQADAIEHVPATFSQLAHAYRTWAVAHPHLHSLLNNRPLDRARLPPGLEERAAAPLIAACHGDRPLARAAWATMKGLVDLELANRFPAGTDLDAVYAAAARAYDNAPPDR